MLVYRYQGDYVVSMVNNGNRQDYSLAEVIVAADENIEYSHLEKLVVTLLNYDSVELRPAVVFAFFIHSTLMQSIDMKVLLSEPNHKTLLKTARWVYEEKGDLFTHFNNTFREVMLRLLATPKVDELISADGSKTVVHITNSRLLETSMEEFVNHTIPRFKAAQSGFVNMVKYVLLGVMTDLENACHGEMMPLVRRLENEELEGLLDYYLSFDFFKKRKQREKTLKEIFELCRDSEICQDFFVGYYEKHKDLFRPAFLEFPQYKFIAGDRFKVYRSFDFFPIVDKRRGNRKKKGTGGGSGYKFDIAENQDNLNGALGMIIRDIEAAGLEYRLINFWPTERLGVVIDEEEVSPYVAVAVVADQRWHILVDGNTVQSAIYYVVGDDFDKLLDIFLLTKKNAKQREGVQHKNHNRNGGAEAYYAKYRSLMSDILAIAR